jgi:predicted RNA binding protein YcfA (HicA-like mRNA interferase family)
MTPRLPTLKPQQVIRALERADFEIDHQTGSHVIMWRATDGRRVVVPWHNRDLGAWLDIADCQKCRPDPRGIHQVAQMTHAAASCARDPLHLSQLLQADW